MAKNWKNKSSHSMSFQLKADEDAVEFFNREMKELEDFENAIHARMKQLFDRLVSFGDSIKSEEVKDAYKMCFKLFMLGYKYGWNDRKELDDSFYELLKQII